MNKKQLLEDVKFPLKWDTKAYKMFIFDSENNMIAQVDRDWDATIDKHPFEKLIGDYKEVPEAKEPTYVNYQGEFFDVSKLPAKYIGLVRGWGRLQYKDNPEQRQDNIAEYIINVLNS